jgi:hypothetical protein
MLHKVLLISIFVIATNPLPVVADEIEDKWNKWSHRSSQIWGTSRQTVTFLSSEILAAWIDNKEYAVNKGQLLNLKSKIDSGEYLFYLVHLNIGNPCEAYSFSPIKSNATVYLSDQSTRKPIEYHGNGNKIIYGRNEIYMVLKFKGSSKGRQPLFHNFVLSGEHLRLKGCKGSREIVKRKQVESHFSFLPAGAPEKSRPPYNYSSSEQIFSFISSSSR